MKTSKGENMTQVNENPGEQINEPGIDGLHGLSESLFEQWVRETQPAGTQIVGGLAAVVYQLPGEDHQRLTTVGLGLSRDEPERIIRGIIRQLELKAQHDPAASASSAS